MKTAEKRNQIIAMLFQCMDKPDAVDTLQLVDEYAPQRPTLSHGEVMEVLLQNGIGFQSNNQTVIGYREKIAKEICQLAPKQVSEEKIKPIVCAAWNEGFANGLVSDGFENDFNDWWNKRGKEWLQSLTPEPKEPSDAQQRFEKAKEYMYCNGGNVDAPLTTGDIKILTALKIAAGLTPEQEEGGGK